MTPVISLLLPVYNTEAYIRRCLDSIVNQSFTDFEVIVVNDSTPDKAMDIVAEYARCASRFVIINKMQNEGSMKARESGYKRARGEYIVFCDSDDYLDERYLEILYKTIVEECAEMALSGYYYVDCQGCILYERKYALPFGNDRLSVFKALLMNIIPHMLWGCIFKRELFVKYSYSCFMNQTHGEDMLLFYEIVNHINKAVVTNVPLYYYCQNMSSATNVRLTDESLKKRLFMGDYWLQYMLSLCVCVDLVYKKAFDDMYVKILSGYKLKIILDGSPTLMKRFSMRSVVNSLGLCAGLDLYLLCRLHSWMFLRLFFKKIFSILR